MVPLQSFATGVLGEVVRRQPPSAARTAFAWELAVGPALARSTNVALVENVLFVHTRSADWAREIQRAVPTILRRLQDLLGTAAVVRLEITMATPTLHRSRTPHR